MKSRALVRDMALYMRRVNPGLAAALIGGWVCMRVAGWLAGRVGGWLGEPAGRRVHADA